MKQTLKIPNQWNHHTLMKQKSVVPHGMIKTDGSRVPTGVFKFNISCREPHETVKKSPVSLSGNDKTTPVSENQPRTITEDLDFALMEFYEDYKSYVIHKI